MSLNNSIYGATEFFKNYSLAEYREFNVTATVQPTASTYIIVTATVFYGIIFILGVSGNALVVTVVSLVRAMKTTMNIYLVNLCIADLLVLILCMPTALTEIYTMEAWLFGEAMCKLVPFLEHTVSNASVLTIIAISVERYRVIKKPFLGITIAENYKKVWIMIVCIWIMSVVASLPWLYIAVYRSSQLVDGTPIMVCRNPIRLYWQQVYITGLTAVFYMLPCLILLTIYIEICRELIRSNKDQEARFGQSEVARIAFYSERKRSQRQVFNLISSIVFVFFLCHLPLRVAGLWFTFEDKDVIYSLGLDGYLTIVYSTRIIFYMNHALNPIVYNFVSKKFRQALKSVCLRNCKKPSLRTPESNQLVLKTSSNRLLHLKTGKSRYAICQQEQETTLFTKTSTETSRL